MRRVLIAAGSDSGGGAGIQADIRTVTALGAYAATAVTALTAQDTTGVHAVLPVPAAFVALQFETALDDIGADAIKTGMLGGADTVRALARALRDRPGIPLVIDPVMTAKGGHALLGAEAAEVLLAELMPLATLIAPNIPEAERLTGIAIATPADMRRAAAALRARGAAAVLLKGGHLPGPALVDLLATGDGVIEFPDRRIETRHTHGTGCTLAAAVATGLAQSMPLADAVRRARAYVRAAIEAAPGFGRGHGPLGHPVRA